MFKKITKWVTELLPKTIVEKDLNQTPAFYKSMANDAFISKFKNQEVGENFPFIVEYMEGSVKLSDTGTNADTITFIKQVHDLPPIIEGMLFQPDMPSANVLPIQTCWEYTYTQFGTTSPAQKYPVASVIGNITKNNFTFNIRTKYTIHDEYADDDSLISSTTTYPYAGQFVKYKLWILRLNI